MGTVVTIGPDLAKSVFQVHGVDEEGAVTVRRRPKRAQVVAFFEQLPPCLVGMEACASARYWGRELRRFGHDVRLMPPAYVKAYLERQKNDAADAEAICKAVTRPSMRFVAIKSPEQQGVMSLHRVRVTLMLQRIQLSNAIRVLVGTCTCPDSKRADCAKKRACLSICAFCRTTWRWPVRRRSCTIARPMFPSSTIV